MSATPRSFTPVALLLFLRIDLSENLTMYTYRIVKVAS